MDPASPVLLNFSAPEIVIAKDQPQYRPLPAVVVNGMVTTRWRLSWRDRLIVFLGGNIWLQILTFGNPLQPVKLSSEEPQMTDEENI